MTIHDLGVDPLPSGDYVPPVPVVYVSGPMRGFEDFNFPSFDEAAFTLRALGYEVISPAESFDRRTDLPAEDYLRKDVGDLLRSDLVVLLPGWENSVGVKVELTVAAAIGLKVYEYESFGEIGEQANELNVDFLLQPTGPRVGEPTKRIEQETVLQAANRIVYGKRQQDYGHPHVDFSKTARLWSVVFGVDVRPEQVSLAMILLKISRLLQTPDHYDSIVDIAGYAGTYDLVITRSKELEASA